MRRYNNNRSALIKIIKFTAETTNQQITAKISVVLEELKTLILKLTQAKLIDQAQQLIILDAGDLGNCYVLSNIHLNQLLAIVHYINQFEAPSDRIDPAQLIPLYSSAYLIEKLKFTLSQMFFSILNYDKELAQYDEQVKAFIEKKTTLFLLHNNHTSL